FHHDGTRWLGSMSGFYPAAGVSAEVFRGGLKAQGTHNGKNRYRR
ncbi:hypothetical protein ABIB38_002307, partial [Massilia sp. UYP11]